MSKANRDKKIAELNLNQVDAIIIQHALAEFKQRMLKRPKWRRMNANQLKHGVNEIVYDYMERNGLLDKA